METGASRASPAPGGHPVAVAPVVAEVPDHRAGPGGALGGEGVGVGLLEHLPRAVVMAYL